jgi:putative ABC transport system permease protein
VSRLLLRAGTRYHLRHPLQLALALLGIALGVAVVVAVGVATGSARRAFTLSTEAVTGRATHEIIGGPAGLAESVYTMLRVQFGVAPAAPVIDRYVSLPTAGGATLRLIGVDPFADAPFRAYVAPSVDDTGGEIDVGALLTGRALLLSAPTAARHGIAVGDSVLVGIGTTVRRAVLAGLLAPGDELAARALDDVIITDIATAQELTGAIGVLDRIELLLPDDDDGARRLSEIQPMLPIGARIVDTRTRSGATLQLTRAFETNLTALALVALVFGMFLIYNSVTFSLVQRRPLIGLLRAQGVTGREVLLLILAEALAMGVLATAAGIAAGWLLGTQLVQLVTRTINDLYFTVSVSSSRLEPALAARALLLGTVATLAAALPPALEAVHTRPRAVLSRASIERGMRSAAPRLALAGGVCAVLAAALLLVPSRSIVLGFAALFILILAAALLTPGATIVLMQILRPALALLGPVARMAGGGTRASLSRTAPAIAALSVAVAVGIAVTIMITSFRAGVVQWLDLTLQADVYVSAPGLGANRTDAALDPALPGRVRALDGVRGVTTYRHTELLLEDQVVRLIALDMNAGHRTAFELLDGTETGAWRAFDAAGVLVSEAFAFRRGLSAGALIRLPTDRGWQNFEVAGVFRDYASEHGVIFMNRTLYDALWDDREVTSLAVFTDGGVDDDVVLERIRALPGAAGIVGRSNAGLRAATLTVFDRTFAITGVLRLLALIVAFVGVTGALMALQLERAREISVLRVIGLTPRQVWALVTSQTALMGLAAAVLALPLGIAMSWAMVHVINRRSFGWSFDMLIGAAPLVQAFAVGIGAALLAGLYPAWRMAR